MRPREPGSYRQAVLLADGARQRAFARAGRVRFDVAVARALDRRRPWYSRWSRQPRRGEPFAAAVARSLRADPAYLHATNELTRYLDAALRHAYRQRQLGDPALRWLLRQLVVVLRPLMGERAAMERVAELVVRRGLLHQRLGAEHGD